MSGVALQEPPRGGLSHGTVADINGQSQGLAFQLHIIHQVITEVSCSDSTQACLTGVLCIVVIAQSPWFCMRPWLTSAAYARAFCASLFAFFVSSSVSTLTWN